MGLLIVEVSNHWACPTTQNYSF